MIISDARFAAALVTSGGDALKFDDVGCLIKHETGELRPGVAYWVRDFRGAGWLDARAATFLHSASIGSPMGHGLAALPAAETAGELATDPSSRTLRFGELPGFLARSSNENVPDLPRPE
jgi:copper chaperone NosL